jgi:hypothetical protein
MKFFVSLLLTLFSIPSCCAEVVKIFPGSGGEVQATRLYSIDYRCDVKSNSLDTVANALDDQIKAHVAKGTLSHIVSIYKQSGDAAPGSPLASTDAIFNTTVLAQDFVPFLHATPQSIFSECNGQIFVNGSSNFIIQAVVTVNSTNVLADALAKGSTLLKSAVSMGYALFSKSQVPPEFTKNVNDTSQLITDYSAFKSIFDAPSDFKVTKTATLRIGTNRIVTYDADQKVTSSVVLRVNPVVSLVADGHTNFISVYNASATSTPLDLNAFAFEELFKKCEFEAQKYYNAGINDDRDIAYLLYRRTLLASNSHQIIAQCMGPKIARAALIIMRQLPTVADGYKITDDDLKNILTDPPSKQPHNRPTLVKDVHALLNMLAGDTQTAPDGLRGTDLSDFKKHVSSTVKVRDRTSGYEIMSLLFGDTVNNERTVAIEEFRASLRKAGIKRWLCEQATKKDKDTSLPLYDPLIDSAVIAIAAKAERADTLDYNKSKLFGVHLLFAPAYNPDLLVVNEIIFEDRLRDVLLKENPTCVSNTPGSTQH